MIAIAGAAGVLKSMSQLPEPTSFTLAASPDPLSGQSVEPVRDAPAPSNQVPQRIPKWLVRIELLLRVMLRMYIGLGLCYAPWSSMFWDQNPIFLQYPAFAAIAGSGAVRGMITGLGLLNLWIALQDVLRHREG